MFVVFTGDVGTGKSLKLAMTTMALLHRNRVWFNKTGVKRAIWSNIKFAQFVHDEYPDVPIHYWLDTSVVAKLRDVDVIWDEVPAALDNTQWENMSMELKRWFQQHDKFGCEIYSTAQDFSQVAKAARRLCTHLEWGRKIIGSRRPAATKPLVNHPWGIVHWRTLDPRKYDEEKSKFEPVGLFDLKFMAIRKIYCQVFDTRQEIGVGSYPDLQHIKRLCQECGAVKIVHV